MGRLEAPASPGMTRVLLYSNEMWSQGVRLWLLGLGPHATGGLICFNDSESGRAAVSTPLGSET